MRVRVNGVELHFDVDGAQLAPENGGVAERPTLVVVHGAPGFADHSGPKPILQALRDVAQVVHLDLRGCGRSESGAPDTWTIDQWADDLFGFCRTLGIDRPVVLGESAGGMVVLAYAASHPDHPAAIVLSSAQARLDVARVLAAFERRGGHEAREAAGRFLTEGLDAGLADYARVCMPLYSGRPGSGAPRPRAVYRADVARSFHEPPAGTWFSADLRDRLSQVAAPTLVLGGEEDPVCPIEDQAEIAAGLPPDLVRFERFEGCGHAPYDDDPERVLAVIRAFVRSNAS